MKRLAFLSLLLIGLSFSGAADHGTCGSFSSDSFPDFNRVHPQNVSLTTGCDFMVRLGSTAVSDFNTSSDSFYLQFTGPLNEDILDADKSNTWSLNPKDSWTDGTTTVLLMEIPGSAVKNTGGSANFSAEMRPGSYSLDAFYNGTGTKTYVDQGGFGQFRLTCPSHADCDPVRNYVEFTSPETCRSYSGSVPLRIAIDSRLLEDGGRYEKGLTHGTFYVGGSNVESFSAAETAAKTVTSTGQVVVELYNPETSASIYFRGPVIEKTDSGYMAHPAPKTYTGESQGCDTVKEQGFDGQVLGMKKDVYSLGQEVPFQVNSSSSLLEEGYRIRVKNPSGSTVCRSALNPGNYSCTLSVNGETGEYTAEIELDSNLFEMIMSLGGGNDVYTNRSFTVVDGLQPWEQKCQNQGFDVMVGDARASYANRADCISNYIVPTCFKPEPGQNCRNVAQNICRDLLETGFNTSSGRCTR